MIIIGAGMAGLLAAAMLRSQATSVSETQPHLPNNHSALLRFRSSIVGDTLNIPFKAVQVVKEVQSANTNSLAAAIAYSIKTTGMATLRSISSARGGIDERFIAPLDLIEKMKQQVMCPIYLDRKVSYAGLTSTPTISTIPMPVLMSILNYKSDLEFKSVPGYTMTCDIANCDVYGTLYYPDEEPWYRASITGSRLIIEFAYPNFTEAEVVSLLKDTLLIRDTSEIVKHVLFQFGMHAPSIGKIAINSSSYAKILPVDDNERKRFILWATEKHNIFSLGRYATWRPGLLLDDLVKDVRQIVRMAGTSNYDMRKN